MSSYPGNAPAFNSPSAPPEMTSEEKEQAEKWKLFEGELKKAQEALSQPGRDVFIRSAEPTRELTALDIKTPIFN